MLSAIEALEHLQQGNERFVNEQMHTPERSSQSRRRAVVAGQEPFAVILGCADSRVPAEIIFDQGIGDLFVIRVAGNIVAPSHIGSVEYAAEHLGTRLVVVLGHSMCGAVLATLNEVRQPSADLSPNLQAIVNYIRPSVEQLLDSELCDDQEQLVHQAVRANVRAAADHLRNGSQLLKALIEEDELLVVGAEYALETGRVTFFDGLPDSAE